jgi:hypothetical protein
MFSFDSTPNINGISNLGSFGLEKNSNFNFNFEPDLDLGTPKNIQQLFNYSNTEIG